MSSFVGSITLGRTRSWSIGESCRYHISIELQVEELSLLLVAEGEYDRDDEFLLFPELSLEDSLSELDESVLPESVELESAVRVSTYSSEFLAEDVPDCKVECAT